MNSIGVSASTPFTVHDLEGMPADGRRYELIDGELLVSPAPGLRHQPRVFTLSFRSWVLGVSERGRVSLT
jgi:hypothetical protein